MFERNTYIVFDLPEELGNIVHDIRVNQKDDFRASLPDEITVAGSSGVGPIAQDQDPNELTRIIDEIAATSQPITISFDEPYRFPGTDTIVMKLKDEIALRALHQKFVDSGIHFQDIEFKYEPHCTLRSRSPLTKEELEEIMKLRIEGEWVLDTLSVYSMPAPMRLLHRVKLSS